MKDDKSPDKKITNKIRVVSADEPKNAFEVLKIQIENFKSLKKISRVPKHADILVIGGGIMGSFVSYWLKTLSSSLEVAVIEQDSTYEKSSTFWSMGGFRQQFSLPENIKMSIFGAEFLQNAQEHLEFEKDNLVSFSEYGRHYLGDLLILSGGDTINHVDHGQKIDLNINHDGYLFLASKNTSNQLYENHKIQLAQNAYVKLFNPEQLKKTFKWLNTEGIELGSFGYQNEGWVDPRKYLLAVRSKSKFLGTDFVNGKLIGFERNNDSTTGIIDNNIYDIKTALIDTFDDKLVPIKFQTVVNAAGPWASDVARLAGIGVGEIGTNTMSVSLPVEPRKRYIYMFYAEGGPILNVPLTIDPSGVFIRRQGLSNYYFCGLNQKEEDEPTNLDLKVIDYDYFEKKIKPVLQHRVPSFKNLKIVDAWAGYYEYNSLDQNLIIGRHPVVNKLLFANGSSGHGLQHAAAIGRAVAELCLHGEYKTIDLKRFGFERVLKDMPLKEIDVV